MFLGHPKFVMPGVDVFALVSSFLLFMTVCAREAVRVLIVSLALDRCRPEDVPAVLDAAKPTTFQDFLRR